MNLIIFVLFLHLFIVHICWRVMLRSTSLCVVRVCHIHCEKLFCYCICIYHHHHPHHHHFDNNIIQKLRQPNDPKISQYKCTYFHLVRVQFGLFATLAFFSLSLSMCPSRNFMLLCSNFFSHAFSRFGISLPLLLLLLLFSDVLCGEIYISI